MNKGDHILISGAGGFLGKHLVRQLLNEGYVNITGIYRTRMDSSLDINWVKADLRQLDLIEGLFNEIDVFIHLAALISYDSKDKEELLSQNQYLTRDLVNIALDKKIQKFIFVSSASTLCKSNQPLIISDSSSGKPFFHTNYSKSKYLSELEVHRGIAEGLNATIFNPCLMIGEDDWTHGSNQIIHRISKGLSFFPAGNIGLVNVELVCKIIIHGLSSPLESGPYLIQQFNPTYKDFISMVCRHLNIPSPKHRLSPSFSRLFALLETVRNRLTNSKKLITFETAKLSGQTFKYERSKKMDFDKFLGEDLDQLVKKTIKFNIN